MNIEKMNKSGGASLMMLNKNYLRREGVSRKHEVMRFVRVAFFG